MPPPPTFSEEEIQAAHNKGFVEGRAEGIAEMGQGIDQRITELLEHISASWTRSAYSTPNSQRRRNSAC